MKSFSKYKKIIVYGFGLVILLNLIGFIKWFDDIYTDYVYWIFANVIGWIMDLFPFAIGEILMYIGALLLIFAVLFAPILLIFRKKEKLKVFIIRYYKLCSLVVLAVLFIYTLTWTIPFRAHELVANEKAPDKFSDEYVIGIREDIVKELNKLAETIERDEDDFPAAKHIDRDTKAAMKALGNEFSRLKGYYPDMKQALCTDFLEYMSIGGYTYPYTLEMTNNKYISELYLPVLYAHEAAHHMGYYKESEAVFLSCIALYRSDNDYLRYCALFEMYWYINDAVFEQLPEDITDEIIKKDIVISDRACVDWARGLDKAVEAYKKDNHPFENIKDKVEDVGNKGWEVQEDVLTDEDEDINYSYDGCVKLFLAYWYETGIR